MHHFKYVTDYQNKNVALILFERYCLTEQLLKYTNFTNWGEGLLAEVKGVNG